MIRHMATQTHKKLKQQAKNFQQRSKD